MKEKIKSYIDSVFAEVKETKKIKEFKEELYANLLDKYYDNLDSGKSENESYTAAIATIGDIEELVNYGEPEKAKVLTYLDETFFDKNPVDIEVDGNLSSKKVLDVQLDDDDFFSKAKKFFTSKPQDYNDEDNIYLDSDAISSEQKEPHVSYVLLSCIVYAFASLCLLGGGFDSVSAAVYLTGTAILVFGNISYKTMKEENKEKQTLYNMINFSFSAISFIPFIVSCININVSNYLTCFICLLLGGSFFLYNKMITFQYESFRVKSAFLCSIGVLFLGASIGTFIGNNGNSVFEFIRCGFAYPMSAFVLLHLLTFKKTASSGNKAITSAIALCSFLISLVLCSGFLRESSGGFSIIIMLLIVVNYFWVIFNSCNRSNIGNLTIFSSLYISISLFVQFTGQEDKVEYIIALAMPSIAVFSLLFYHYKLTMARKNAPSRQGNIFKKAFQYFIGYYWFLSVIICYGIITNFSITTVLAIIPMTQLVIINFYSSIKESGFRR